MKIPYALFNSTALFNPYQYEPFFKIFDENLNWNNKNILIADEVGVGKTFETGIILQEFLSKVENADKKVLIICPVKLCANWESEMSENFGLNFENLHKKKFLTTAKKIYSKYNIIPYSIFNKQSNNNKDDEEELILKNVDSEYNEIQLSTEQENILSKLEYDILILDEAHYIRNQNNLRYCIKHLIEKNEQTKEKLRIFLSATPVFNSDKDLENVEELLKMSKDPNLEREVERSTTLQAESNLYDFYLNIGVKEITLSEVEQKIIDDIYEMVEADGSEHLKTKYGRLTGFLKRISASSIYALDEFVKGRINNDTNEEGTLKDYFNTVKDDYYNEGNENDLVELSTLLQKWSKKDDTKLNILKEEIDNIMSQGNNDAKKVVIFSSFISTCEYLKTQLSDYSTYIITGKTDAKKVEDAIYNFRKDKFAILICSDAAKEGHNFQFCQNLIHYDFPFTPAALIQRNGRIYRKGQEGLPKITYMSVKNSYDERLFGEIIIGKTNILNDLSEEDRIAKVDILPKDGNKCVEYCKTCLVKYYEEQVKKRIYESIRNYKKENNEQRYTGNTGNIIDIKHFEFEFLKEFFKNTIPDRSIISLREREKKFAKTGLIYESISDEELKNIEKKFSLTKDFKNIEKNFRLTKDFKDFASDLFIKEQDNNALISMYRLKYNAKLNEFNRRVFLEPDNNDAPIVTFIEHCKKQTKDSQSKFCHDMIKLDANNNMIEPGGENNIEKGLYLNVKDYKDQFKPLNYSRRIYVGK